MLERTRILALLLGMGAALPAGASALLVEAAGFADNGGAAHLSVYSSRVGFPDQPRFSEQQPIADGSARWEIGDLPTGDYAVLVWHDRDGDGALDRSMFGAPREPYGYSNAVRGNNPDWDAVRVPLGPDPLTLRVQVE